MVTVWDRSLQKSYLTEVSVSRMHRCSNATGNCALPGVLSYGKVVFAKGELWNLKCFCWLGLCSRFCNTPFCLGSCYTSPPKINWEQ